MPTRFGVAILPNASIQTVVEQVRLAEEIGFDSAWLIDSQLICREVFVTLAACAVSTSRIKLATGVTLPGTRHSTVAASAFATLQELSGGRIMVGIGRGNSALRTIGREPASLNSFERYVSELKDLLGARPISLENGATASVAWLSEPAGVPVFLAATGPKMTELAGRIGDGVLLFQGASPELVQPAIHRVLEAARGAGRDSPPRVACWAVLGVGADRALARRHVRGRVAAIAKISNADAFDGQDRESVLRIQEGYQYLDHASAEAEHADLVTDGLIDRFALAGDPQEVRARLDRLLAIDELSDIILSPQVSGGEGSFEQTLRTFAEDVANDVL